MGQANWQTGHTECPKNLPKDLAQYVRDLGIDPNSKLYCAIEHVGKRESCMNPKDTSPDHTASGIFQMSRQDRRDFSAIIRSLKNHPISLRFFKDGCSSVPGSGTLQEKCDALSLAFSLGQNPGGFPLFWGVLGYALKDCKIQTTPTVAWKELEWHGPVSAPSPHQDTVMPIPDSNNSKSSQ